MKIFKALRKSLTILIGLFVLLSSITARAESVNVTVGEGLKYPNGFAYMTHYFYMDGKLAYCLQPKLGPTSNGTYEAKEISSEGNDGYPLLVKVLACGYGGPNDLTPIYFPGASEKERYIYTHIAAGYAYMSNAQMNNTINDITGLTDEQFEACGLGDFVRAAWETDFKGTVKIATFNSYQDIGYLASYSRKPGKIQIEITKKDINEDCLPGAEYSIYEDENCTVLIKTMTKTDGYGKTIAEFEKSDKYVYIKETSAPKGYKLDNSVIKVSLSDNQSLERYDDEILGSLFFQKSDSRGNDSFKGNASLKGSEYQLYAKETIKNELTGRIFYEKDDYIATITTNESGIGQINGLHAGKYYLVESKEPEGYQLNDQIIEAELKLPQGEATAMEIKVSASDDIIMAPIEIVKYKSGDRNTKVKGAGFSVYLKSDMRIVNGKYDYKNSNPLPIGSKGETILYTDSNGYLRTVDLPYGTYIVHESVVPKNYLAADDYEVTIDSGISSVINKTLNIPDDYYKIKFRINKVDETSKKLICLNSDQNAVFSIYDLTRGKYVEENIKTGPDGHAYSSVYLEAGKYRIEEKTAPKGYVLANKNVEIEINEDSKSVYDEKIKENVISVDFKNETVKGKLYIKKTGEKLSEVKIGDEKEGSNAVFVYKYVPLDGVEFGIYAKNDIYLPDGSKDEKGKRVVAYEKDTLIASIITDENGEACYSSDKKPLVIGDYYIKEISVPDGFMEDDSIKEFSIKGQSDSSKYINVENVRKRYEVLVNKVDEDTNERLKGAYFAIYAGEDIKNMDGDVIVKSGEFLGVSNKDDQGISKFNLDLTKNKYIVKEIVAPEGYEINEEEFMVNFDNEENLQKLVSEITIHDKKLPKEKKDKKRKTIVKGVSSKKVIKNNYQTDDNGVEGYSILIDENNGFNIKYILGAGLLLIALIVSVGLLKNGKKDKKK